MSWSRFTILFINTSVMTRDMGMNQTMEGHLKTLLEQYFDRIQYCDWGCLAIATYFFKSIVATITRGVYWLCITRMGKMSYFVFDSWILHCFQQNIECKSWVFKKKSLRFFRNLGCLHSLPASRTYFKGGPRMEPWGSLCFSSTLFEK